MTQEELQTLLKISELFEKGEVGLAQLEQLHELISNIQPVRHFKDAIEP